MCSLQLAHGLSGPWLVHAHLNLLFTQAIATAMTLAPEQRPAAPVLRQHHGYWCNMRASHRTVHLF